MVSRWAERVAGSEAVRRVYIVPRELAGRIKPHGEGDGRRGQRRGTPGEGTAGEESERISWPTQKPTLLMTLSAVISGCYLSWLPGAHLLRITNLYTPLLHFSFSRLLRATLPLHRRFPAPVLARPRIGITESGDLFSGAPLPGGGVMYIF